MLMDYLTYVNDLDIDDSIKLKAKSLYEDFKESSPYIILPELVDIQITGLYPYKSDHTIRVKNEKANIIYGGNGAGKTTCINSIEFGLLGSSSDIEIKTNFSNRVINKYTIKTQLIIDKKKYLLERSLSPFGESHDVTFQRISDNDMEHFYEIYEGVQEVNVIFYSLTGLTFPDYAKVFDFFSLRVPRRHYLASVIFNTNGAVWRQRIFSKLIGENIVVKLSEEFFKKWNSCRSAVSKNKRNIATYENINQMEINQVIKTPDSTEIERETTENELLSTKNKLISLKEEKKKYQEKSDDLRKKFIDSIKNDQLRQDDFAEKKTKLDKIESMKQNKWICNVCESDYSEEAQERLNHGHCPVCGSESNYNESFFSQETYNSLREEIHTLNLLRKKSDERLQKFNILQDKISKEIIALDREIDALNDKVNQIKQESQLLTSGRTQDVLLQLQQDLQQLEQEESLFNSLYEITKQFLNNQISELISQLNDRFTYYQRELFDTSKWSLTPSFDIVAEDNQEFKHLSHGEKNITDILFRMAVFDVLKDLKPDQNLFFLIDTPEEGLDAAFYKRFQTVFIDFVKNHKNNLIVFTSCEREFVDNLDSNIFRLENLLIKSSNSRPFQVKQLSLLQFINLN